LHSQDQLDIDMAYWH